MSPESAGDSIDIPAGKDTLADQCKIRHVRMDCRTVSGNSMNLYEIVYGMLSCWGWPVALLRRNLAAHAVKPPPRKWKCQQPSTRCCYSMLLSWATAQAHGWALSCSSSMTWQLDCSSVLQSHVLLCFSDWICLSSISRFYGSHSWAFWKVRNVANFGRLQEECDVMSLVLAPCPRLLRGRRFFNHSINYNQLLLSHRR